MAGPRRSHTGFPPARGRTTDTMVFLMAAGVKADREHPQSHRRRHCHAVCDLAHGKGQEWRPGAKLPPPPDEPQAAICAHPCEPPAGNGGDSPLESCFEQAARQSPEFPFTYTDSGKRQEAAASVPKLIATPAFALLAGKGIAVIASDVRAPHSENGCARAFQRQARERVNARQVLPKHILISAGTRCTIFRHLAK